MIKQRSTGHYMIAHLLALEVMKRSIVRSSDRGLSTTWGRVQFCLLTTLVVLLALYLNVASECEALFVDSGVYTPAFLQSASDSQNKEIRSN
ncbi:hypothetical protein OE88DRAFT_1653991 [Heliocybe sulcata]|uniref:Uncharacterized protein n=1 Tax=Heliocybe sulcata TaxID=5364 RepID=A0A5C3NDX2_9AGAM|nr:hypothetical protein OE88DRAFT_1653991 [Heliocybe sulcata]